jgi:hypothetical protein
MHYSLQSTALGINAPYMLAALPIRHCAVCVLWLVLMAVAILS